VIKDAGDDPDVTHGCRIVVTVRLAPGGRGIVFRAGEGVGTVTRPGLPIPPGEPAINPVPRQMMRDAVGRICAEAGAAADLELTVAIPGGAEIASRTLNPRLGILGGLSILGTTGVVIPYSCSSWIHSIHRGIDVARAAGINHVGAATGRTSEAFLRSELGLPEMALIDMGDFAGGMLKYLRHHPVPHVSLAGGVGKLAKLGQGALDLHNSRSRLDRLQLRALLERHGAPPRLLGRIAEMPTAATLLDDTEGFRPGDVVAEEARRVAQATVGAAVAVEVLVVDRAGEIAGVARGW
jgi:cobalt-precorrin-5B (C1)-methyltransferase